jgi:hypothetical protein
MKGVFAMRNAISIKTIAIIATIVGIVGGIIYMMKNPTDVMLVSNAMSVVGGRDTFNNEVKLIEKATNVSPEKVKNVRITWLYADGLLDTYIDIEKYQVSVMGNPEHELAKSLWGISHHGDAISMRLDWEIGNQKYSAIDKGVDGDWDVVAMTSNGEQPLTWIVDPYAIPKHRWCVEYYATGNSIFTTYHSEASVVRAEWEKAPTIDQMVEVF